MLGEIVFEREQPLLVRERLYLSFIGVNFCNDSLFQLLQTLLINGVPLVSCDCSDATRAFAAITCKYSAADSENDDVARILGCEPIRAGEIA